MPDISKRRTRTRSLSSLATLWVLTAIPCAAAALNFYVDITVTSWDVAQGDGICADHNGDCSLRAAVQEANASPGEDWILLREGVYRLGLAGRGDDVSIFGDLDVTDTSGQLVIVGSGPDLTFIEGEGLDRLFDVHRGADLALLGVSITGGDPGAEPGGGLRNAGHLTVSGSRIHGNRSDAFGTGIANYADLYIGQTEISANDGWKGAVANGSTSTIAAASATIESSTFWGNTSTATPSALEIGNATAADLSNVTIAGPPGTLVFIQDTDVTLQHVTIAGPLGVLSSDGTHELVFQNTAVEICSIATQSPRLDYRGINASAFDMCGFAAHGGIVAPLDLELLGDYGGSTWTMPPTRASALVDAADNGVCLMTDQRGELRPQDGDGDGTAHCDIGAVELPEPSGALWAGLILVAALSQRRS